MPDYLLSPKSPLPEEHDLDLLRVQKFLRTSHCNSTHSGITPASKVSGEAGGSSELPKILFRHGKGDGWLDDETNEIYPRHLPRVRVSETLLR